MPFTSTIDTEYKMDMYDPKDIGVGNDITALAPYFRLGLDLTRAQDEEAEKPWQIDQDLTDVQIPKYLGM